MARYIDFDAARAERQREPVIVRLFCRDWELPADLPAAAMLDLVRLHAKGAETEVSEMEMLTVLQGIVPRATLDAWVAEGLGFVELVELLKEIIALYRADPDTDAGEAPTLSATQAAPSANAGG